MDLMTPRFKTCCHSPSRRIVLLSWGCFKMLINVGLLPLFLVYTIRGATAAEKNGYPAPSLRDNLTSVSVIMSAVLIDSIQNALLITGVLYRNTRLLKEYFQFTIVWSTVVAVGGIILLCLYLQDLSNQKFMSDYKICILFLEVIAFFGYLGFQAYIVGLTKNEIDEMNIERLTEFGSSVSSLINY